MMAVEMKREIQGVVVAIAGNKAATILVERRVMHSRYHKFVKRFKKYIVQMLWADREALEKNSAYNQF